MNILVTICARGGSKGIPGKNIRPLAGKPLIGYTIEAARRFAEFASAEGCHVAVALSTDSPEIIATAAGCGLESDYRRPDSLAGDAVGKIDAITDILRHAEATSDRRFDYVLDLDVTSPLRTLDDLREAFRMLKADPQALNIFSVSDAARNPYFNMVEQQPDGYFRQVKPLPSAVMSRQSAPKVYDLNASFYIYRREFFSLGLRGAITGRSLVYPMSHICFDLDHPVDFEFLQYLIENRKLDFDI